MGEWRKSRRRQLDGGQAVSRGRVKLYVSHGASSMPDDTDDLSFGESGDFVDWFIVEPRDNPDRQVESLRRAGRTVVCVRVRPWTWRHRLTRRWRDLRYRMSR